MVVSMGISDGISTTLLEAMSLGVFPIQSDTSCACEWVRNGQDGSVLGPHDVAGVADALVRVAEDDDLVDAAAIRNRAVVEQRWNSGVNGATARSYYQAMLGGAWAIQPELRA
jgi:glycosyltransferase involved in cell wall biosynthesis